ncbi:MAG: DUF2946 family protein [Betaproteobacteria bacterium]|nr:DUF2946 family protein [Betaproteobacteria bacterium]
MDDSVARAMHKWPNVPNVYGWLRLDRRGNWLVKSRLGAFERIGNRAVVDFIGRNYAADAHGRWFFQNGPQRVYVSLDYTPWVFRLSEGSDSLVAHNEGAAGVLNSVLVDDAGALLVDCAMGVGVISDRDLAPLVERIANENPVLEGGEALQMLAGARLPPLLKLFGGEISLGRIRCTAVPLIFGFDPSPEPPKGDPDC